MKDHRFNNAIKEVQKLGMTREEKLALKNRILGSFDAAANGLTLNDVMTEPRPYRKSPWSSFYFHHKVISVVVVVALVVFLAGGGVAMASDDALPGDALYGVKVNVVEPIIGSFAATPSLKAAWEAQLVTNRLSEASKLAGEGRLDDEKEARVSKLLDKHTEAYIAAVNDVEKTESKEKATGLVTSLKASISAHAKLFNDISVISTSSVSTEAKISSDNARNATVAKPNESKNREAASKFSRKAEMHVSEIGGSWTATPEVPQIIEPIKVDTDINSDDATVRPVEARGNPTKNKKVEAEINTASAAAAVNAIIEVKKANAEDSKPQNTPNTAATAEVKAGAAINTPIVDVNIDAGKSDLGKTKGKGNIEVKL